MGSKKVRKTRFGGVETVIKWTTATESDVRFEFYVDGLAATVSGKLNMWDLVNLANKCTAALRHMRKARAAALASCDEALRSLGGGQ